MINLRFEVGSTIKSQSAGKQIVSTVVEQPNHLPPLKDFMRGLVQDRDILIEAPPGYRKTFSFLTFA